MKYFAINDSPKMIKNPFGTRLQFWEKMDIYRDIVKKSKSKSKDEL